MSTINRRHFLQCAGAAIASIGFSQLDLITQAERTARVLAQPTRRKLALLVGINQYSSEITSLNGCLTDVEMQYELLCHRYGFHPADILMLTDKTLQQPTRNNILAAFETHLIQQAKPADVVVFHYSGHGGLIADPEPLDRTKLNGTLIPADSTPDNRNDIMGRTLFLLSSQIQTDFFTMVLDSCYSGGGLRGNQVVRALLRSSKEPLPNPSLTELQYQRQQLQKLGWSRSEFQARRSQGIAKGVAIGSTTKDWLALDASFDGFHAGAFTYLLTRYLWQLPKSEPVSLTFDRLALITQEFAGASGNPQIPVKEVAPGKPFDQRAIYQLTTERPSAEAVVRQVMPNGAISFWLGGVSSRNLEAFQPGSLFSVMDDNGNEIAEISQNHRVGLEGYGTLKSGQPPQVGMLLREKLRNLPAELFLKVGLDSSLEKDRDAIAQALETIPQIQVVPINQQGLIDVILSRLTGSTRQARKDLGINIAQPEGSVGLFTAANIPIINSFGRLGESPQLIIARLRPRLKMLLARQLLSLMLNGEASQLKVDIHLRSRQDGTVQVLSRSSDTSLQSGSPKPYKADSVVDIDVVNREENSVYLAVLAIADDGAITVLHPANWDSPEAAAIIRPQAKTTVPMEVYGPAGFFEVLVFTSTLPLRDTLRGLQAIARSRGISSDQFLTFDGKTRSANDSEDSIIQTTRSLINDITNAGTKPASDDTPDRRLDPQQSGVFSAILQVVD